MTIFIQKISIVLDHETKSSHRLFNICLSTNMITALVIPLSFILATLTTITMMGPAVYAYNNDYNNNVMETVSDNHGQLNFVSTMTTTNNSSSVGSENATSNSTMSQIPS